jgi:hypothetical protein
MEKLKKTESGDADARERREKGEMTGDERADRELRRANIAGEYYVPPGEASPAYAPGTGQESRMARRANLAGESYGPPAEKAELHKPGKKK